RQSLLRSWTDGGVRSHGKLGRREPGGPRNTRGTRGTCLGRGPRQAHALRGACGSAPPRVRRGRLRGDHRLVVDRYAVRAHLWTQPLRGRETHPRRTQAPREEGYRRDSQAACNAPRGSVAPVEVTMSGHSRLGRLRPWQWTLSSLTVWNTSR